MDRIVPICKSDTGHAVFGKIVCFNLQLLLLKIRFLFACSVSAVCEIYIFDKSIICCSHGKAPPDEMRLNWIDSELIGTMSGWTLFVIWIALLLLWIQCVHFGATHDLLRFSFFCFLHFATFHNDNRYSTEIVGCDRASLFALRFVWKTIRKNKIWCVFVFGALGCGTESRDGAQRDRERALYTVECCKCVVLSSFSSFTLYTTAYAARVFDLSERHIYHGATHTNIGERMRLPLSREWVCWVEQRL